MRLQSTLRGAAPAALLVLLLAAACAEEPRPVRGSPDAAPPSLLDRQLALSGMMDPAAAGHVRGAAAAPVTVIEFGDFGCPYCALFATQTYPVLHREYVETGRVRWRTVQFVLGTFPNGGEAARAAECATEQGEPAFWAMHDLLYARQREWKRAGDPEALFGRYAADAGLDTERFGSCYRENRSHLRVMASNALAAESGVRATPTFFINGMRVQGALPLEQFRMVLDELAR